MQAFRKGCECTLKHSRSSTSSRTLTRGTKATRTSCTRSQLHRTKNKCRIGKYFGGDWVSKFYTTDGAKYICLDRIYEDIKQDKCLIYSFGLADDWSFEEQMASMGCQVRAFDPTVTENPEQKHLVLRPCPLNLYSNRDQRREQGHQGQLQTSVPTPTPSSRS